ncbi:uncharacterized protein LOC126824050 isoform X2 [Patella vulgata]|uniref:uncharacterized protein LOC126824050 isoform X2 n=1 Tax=Patella vulgata TaxID=6465 RepID=UPI00218072CF|nr:uncharacterized protein LOC126824050 isoform X2 [Patella vulgata]
MKDMSSYGDTEVLWPRSDAVSPKVADVIDRGMSASNEIKQERPHQFYPQSSVHLSPVPKEKDFKSYPHLNSTFNDNYKSASVAYDQQREADDNQQRPSASSPCYSESESCSQSPNFEDTSPRKSFHFGEKSESNFSYGEKTPEKSYPTTAEGSPNSGHPYGLKPTRSPGHSQSFNTNDTPESSPLKSYHTQNHTATSSPESPYPNSAEKSKYSLDLSSQFPFGPSFQRETLMHIKETLPTSFPLPAIPQLNISPGSSSGFTNGDSNKYFCHLCSYAGDSKPDFDQHMSIHFEYSCPHCDYTSRTEGRLKRHIKDFHTDDNDPNGKNQRTMPGRPKVYRCKQCDYVATIKTDFWQHSRTHIKEDKILQCPRCPFVTEYKHHLEYHLRNHFGSKPFKCNKCNYSCVNKSMLNSHMKSHTNVYQYRCADCTYATKYCHSLKLHLRKYNHKPATVLNNDGSLPQGLDADLSGLSLLAKRGPPRGPRSTNKRDEPEYMSPMFPFPGRPGMMGMPSLPHGLNGAMMTPYWPLLNQMSGWNPHLPMAPNGMTPMSLQGRMLESGPGGMGPVSCTLCSFTAESPEKLRGHLMKVHASENQDLFNAYGISSDSLMEDAYKMKQNGMNGKKPGTTPERPSSHSDMLHVRTDTGLETSKASPHSWPANTPNNHSSSTNISSRSLPELYNGSAKDQKIKEEPDILREMTLKFGSSHNNSPPSMDREGALDLTKPRSESPPHHQYSTLKRPYPEQELSSSAENSINGETSTPNPRKRSRKGKAYKLDTLCLKLQDEKSSYESENESVESNGDGPAEMVSDSRGNEHVNPTGDGAESDGSNPLHINEDHYDNQPNEKTNGSSPNTISEFEKIQANLKYLNGETDENIRNGEMKESNGIEGQESPLDLLNSVYQNRRKPMSSALRRGAEVAWKILNDPASGEKALVNGDSLDVPPSPTQIGKKDSMNFTPSPTAKKQLKDFPFHRAESYECTFCDIAFRDCVMYTMHMGYHGYQNPYKCNMCGNISRDKVEFFLHIARTAHN